MNLNDSILLFECCKLVKGAKFSIIYDLQRDKQRCIPNDFATLLDRCNGHRLAHILSNYDKSLHDIILENLNLLIVEEFCFLTDCPDKFPKMSSYWNEPSQVTNAILVYSNDLVHKFETIIKQLSTLGCEHCELRIYELIELDHLISMLSKFNGSRISSLQVLLKYNYKISNPQAQELTENFPRLASLVFHSAPLNKVIAKGIDNFGLIENSIIKLKNDIHCGTFGHDLFTVNIKMFTESLKHNSCLNRKISIDAEGNIKNCPSMKESFGNIKDTSLVKAIEKPGFKKYEDINKDKIHVCKDCEFRYMCHDCRAYVEDPEDILSKPLKCGYNPYTGEWSEWSVNPLKQKTIDFYGMRNMVEKI